MSPYQQTTEALRNLLTTGDEVDRCYAARALGTMGDKEAVDPLIESLRDEDIDVCVDAVEALGRIGDIRAAASIIESLENDSSAEVCTVAATTLGLLHSEEAIDALRQVIIQRPERIEWDDQWDRWWDIQLEAIKTLGQFGYENNVQILLDIIDDEGHQDIECELLATLVLTPGKGVDSVINRLQDKELRPQKRWRAARALGKADSTEAVTALGRALQIGIPEIRAEAAAALAEQGAQRYLRALLLLLRDESEVVRREAIRAITTLADKADEESELPEDLLSLVTDPSESVRTALFETLASMLKHGKEPLNDELFEAILPNLDSKDFNTACATCTLLGKNGDNRAVAPLLALLADHSIYLMTRRQAALALGDIGDDSSEVIEALAHAVGDKEQTIRLAALSALRSLHREDAQSETLSTESAESIEAEEEAEENAVPLTPLGIILAAIQGKIEINSERAEATASEEAESETVEDEADIESTEEESLANDDESAEGNTSLSEIAAKSTDEEAKLVLPEHKNRVVEPGEFNTAQSTMDAIALDNVEVTLGLHEAEEEEAPLDEEAEHYLGVAEDGKALMTRMRSHREITPKQDVRLLGVRILIGLDTEESSQALIDALNDEDNALRKEAALAIAESIEQGAKHPLLMDSLGSMVAQLALGERDLRRACARALGVLGNHAAATPLLNALQDEDINVRIQVMESLAHLLAHGDDPVASDHMVTDPVSAKVAAEAIAEQLAHKEISIRVAAARALAKIVQLEEAQEIAQEMIEKTIDSAFEQDGEEARILGKILRQAELEMVTNKLLAKLNEAEDSVVRSVAVEMLEELYNPKTEAA
ncbi:MAG: HEAT repeat domain-containing protein [Candidatus Polarisedimenticolaceae bacterium]|nr:HEAT repeat domain-containing protein [Candidatus Polarisedimenticolaceae bacterium]